MWTDWSCAVNRNRKVGTNSLEPRGTNSVQTEAPLSQTPVDFVPLILPLGVIALSDAERKLSRCCMWAWAHLPKNKSTNKQKKPKTPEWSKTRPALHSSAALVPPSAGALGPVTSSCLPNGPQAQGPLKGWVPSLNKAWEMPARPRVTNRLSETCTRYHEVKKEKKKSEKNARKTDEHRKNASCTSPSYLPA